ncbi:MAG: TIGR03663 family protein [candidate division KSB1 bacterium]|nr:TIGR03663 family protein [candidate division KSB1 bacterium]
MKRKVTLVFSWGAVLLTGAVLRFSALEQRPMHTDEAVHAIKFQNLLQDQEYEYDPFEYHGPTLNVFSLLPCSLTGVDTIAATTERHLRMVPALFGWLLILTPLLAVTLIGHRAAGLAGVFIAISPAFVFYSRYYIQEMLLVVFIMSALLLFVLAVRDQRRLFVFLSGLCWGLAAATKETWIIPAGILAMMSVIFTVLHQRNLAGSLTRYLMFGLLLLGGFVLPFVIFYSEWFTDFGALSKPFEAFSVYLNRAGGGAHLHPWWTYFRWYGFYNSADSFYTEGFILLSALGGLTMAVHRRFTETSLLFLGLPTCFRKYAAVFTLAIAGIYILLPYKTPWSFLTVWVIFSVWAGLFWKQLFELVKNRLWILALAVLISGTVHLLAQTLQLNFKYDAHPQNPYVYGHTSPDILNLVDTVRDICAAVPDSENYHIEVIMPGHDYWPLPWYLRNIEYVGWYDSVPQTLPLPKLVVIPPEFETDLVRRIYELPPPGERLLYVPLAKSSYFLRPDVQLEVFVQKRWRDPLQN